MELKSEKKSQIITQQNTHWREWGSERDWVKIQTSMTLFIGSWCATCSLSLSSKYKHGKDVFFYIILDSDISLWENTLAHKSFTRKQIICEMNKMLQ